MNLSDAIQQLFSVVSKELRDIALIAVGILLRVDAAARLGVLAEIMVL